MPQLKFTEDGFPYLIDDSTGSPVATQDPRWSTGTNMLDKLLGMGGKERYQLWPEKMIRSAVLLPGEVLRGQVPVETNAAIPGAVEPGSGISLAEPGFLASAVGRTNPLTVLDPNTTQSRVNDLAGLVMGGGMPVAAASDAMRGALGTAGGKLTRKELKILRDYEEDGQINRYLWDKKKLTPEYREQRDILDSIIEKSDPLEKPLTVYRALQSDVANPEDFIPGTTVKWPHYPSTARKERRLGNSWGNVKFEIQVPEGAKVLDTRGITVKRGRDPVTGDLSEVVLPRGSEFNVDKVDHFTNPKKQGKSWQYTWGDEVREFSTEDEAWDHWSKTREEFRKAEGRDPDRARVYLTMKNKLRSGGNEDSPGVVIPGTQDWTTHKNGPVLEVRDGYGALRARMDPKMTPEEAIRWAAQDQLKQGKSLTPVWHSAVENAVSNAKQQLGSPEQWMGMIKNSPGVKPEELQWLGLEDWMRQQKHPVSKEDIAEYLRSHRVEVKDALNTNSGMDRDTLRELERDQDAIAEELHQNWSQGDYSGFHIAQEGGHFKLKHGNYLVETYGTKNAADRAYDKAVQAVKEYKEKEDVPDHLYDIESAILEHALPESEYGEVGRHAEYQLPGGENYNELLLHLPKKLELDPKMAQLYEWAKKNPDDAREHNVEDIAQRFGIPEGKAYTVMEHLSRGKDLPAGQNYQSSHWDEPNVLAHVRFNDRVIDGKKTLFMEEVQSDWHQEGRKEGYKELNDKQLQPLLDKLGLKKEQVSSPRLFNAVNENKITPQEADLIERILHARSVPDAPFKKTWPDLVLKRMIRYAAENGYDKIAWTPGEVQAKRWRGTGEEGHGKFYDEILVNAANKLGKAHGAKVQSETLTHPPAKGLSGEQVMELLGTEGRKKYGIPEETNKRSVWWKKAFEKGDDFVDKVTEEASLKREPDKQSVHTLDITPQLKNTALRKGMPLFVRGVPIMPVQGNPHTDSKDLELMKKEFNK